MKRLLPAALLVTALLCNQGCLFSTTPPERSEPPQSGGDEDPNLVVITGLVQLKRGPGEFRIQPGWGVQAVWYGADRDRDGAPDKLIRKVVRSGNQGVYETKLSHRDISGVDLMAVRCSFDPDDPRFECCLDLFNPCSDCPAVWTNPVRVAAAPGARITKSLVVPCSSGPGD